MTKEHTEAEVENALRRKVNELVEASVDAVIAERERHYAKHPEKLMTRERCGVRVEQVAGMNAAISGGMSLVPGPWGALAILPELGIVLRNQLALIYDIGVAHGKKEFLTRELLLALMTTGIGGGALGVFVVKGQQVLVKRASLRVIQRIIVWLGGRVTQRVLKAFLAKWVPLAGAAAMAIWMNVMTRNIGNKAIEIFSKDFVREEDMA